MAVYLLVQCESCGKPYRVRPESHAIGTPYTCRYCQPTSQAQAKARLLAAIEKANQPETTTMAHQTHQPKFKASQGYCLDCGADHSGFTCDQFCTMRAKALREQAAHASTTAAEPQDGTKVQGYRKLSDAEIDVMNSLKETSRYFIATLNQYRDEVRARIDGSAMQSQEQREADEAALRWIAIARTEMQKACMFGCRAVARPADDC